MAVDDTLVPLSQSGKLPELYPLGDGDSAKEKQLAQIEMSSPLIGLTKEQLEKYRNDPFWKPFRMFMFVLFWLIWIAMFAGAILIVVLSPKCVPKTEPEWWRTKVSYQIFTPSFRDSSGDGVGDFNGIAEKLEAIRKIGVQNVWVTPVIATDKDDFEPFDVVDFQQTDERFGTEEEFRNLVKEVHQKNMHLVMDLPISTTSQKHAWFVKASKGDVDYKDFYLWEKSDDVKDDPAYAPLKDSTESFMVYDKRSPVLNWHNSRVKEAITKAAKKYLDIGVDGFHIGYVNQLGKNRPMASNTREALEALEYFKMELESYASTSNELKEKKIAVFTSLEDITQLNGGPVHDIEDLNVTSIEYVIDGSAKSLDEDRCSGSIGSCVYSMLERSLEHFKRANLPHVWQFSDYRVSRLNSRFSDTLGTLLTFLQLTLPGAVEIYYGQELGMKDTENTTRDYTGIMQWDDSAKAGFTEKTNLQLFFGMTADYKEINYKTEYEKSYSPLKVFKTLANLRQRDDTLLLGEMKLHISRDTDVISFLRTRVGLETAPEYFVVANFANAERSVNLTSLIPAEKQKGKIEVVVTTGGCKTYNAREVIDPEKELLRIPQHQGILIKFG